MREFVDNFVFALCTYLSTSGGIIWDSSAASIVDCHVLVELGITNPKLNLHSGD